MPATSYSPAMKLLHWLMAVLVIGLITVGVVMTGLEKADPLRAELYGLHKATGILLLMLLALRVAVRGGSIVPPLVNGRPGWEQRAAHLGHFFLYLLMFAVPVAGYAMSSAGGKPVNFFGLFELPLLIEPDKGTARSARQLHETLAWLLAVVVVIHVLAALRHHFVLRDNTLRRMLPGRSDPQG